ncbi:MAG: site-specific integrase, partial [Planctomycetota bacterium]
VNEIQALLEATAAAPKRFGMTGYERCLLYRFAAETGLRANEIRSLTVASFDFNKLTVSVRADDSKRKRPDILPLRPELKELLKEFFKGKMPKAKAFGGTRKQLTKRTSDMIKDDLEGTGIPYVDEAEQYADFHSLRHTTGSLLAASGVHPKVAQSIMRHSDINLTMSRYSHTYLEQESEAIGRLPDFSLNGIQRAKATGTDGEQTDGAHKPAYKKLAKNAYSGCDPSSSVGTNNGIKDVIKTPLADLHKSIKNKAIGNDCQPMASTKLSRSATSPWSYSKMQIAAYKKPKLRLFRKLRRRQSKPGMLRTTRCILIPFRNSFVN